MRFERTQIHSFSDVFTVDVIVVVAPQASGPVFVG